MGSPFDGIPGARLSEFDVAPRIAGAKVKTCDWSGKQRRKPVDLGPQQRAWFERNGWTYARQEYRDYIGKKHDLWSFGDWLAVRGEEVVIVQTCIHADASKRENKARMAPELAVWLASENRRFEVHGWRQLGGRGSRWEVVIRDVRLEVKPC